MSIDKTVTQLEFPFLERVRMQGYIKFQKDEMLSVYNLHYKHGGDHGKEMRFGDFIADVWIKGGFAKRFHEMYHKQYFYDSPQYTKVYTSMG